MASFIDAHGVFHLSPGHPLFRRSWRLSITPAQRLSPDANGVIQPQANQPNAYPLTPTASFIPAQANGLGFMAKTHLSAESAIHVDLSTGTNGVTVAECSADYLVPGCSFTRARFPL